MFSPDDDDFCPLVGEEDDVSVALKNSLVDWNSKDSTRLLELVHKLRCFLFFVLVELDC